MKENKDEIASSFEVKTYKPHIPYPTRLQNKREDKNFMKFIEMFKKLHINIPFAEALKQM